MGFYIRKAFNFGPFRLNLSKKGLGTSVGVKGLRVSTGPRGTELNGGRYGLYYRQKLGNAPEVDADSPPVQSSSSEVDDIPPIQTMSGGDASPPVQVVSGKGLSFALIVLAVLVTGFMALLHFLG